MDMITKFKLFESAGEGDIIYIGKLREKYLIDEGVNNRGIDYKTFDVEGMLKELMERGVRKDEFVRMEENVNGEWINRSQTGKDDELPNNISKVENIYIHENRILLFLKRELRRGEGNTGYDIAKRNECLFDDELHYYNNSYMDNYRIIIINNEEDDDEDVEWGDIKIRKL